MNNPAPFLIGASLMYSSLGGSPPKLSELSVSMIMLISKICTEVSTGIAIIIGKKILSTNKLILIGNWNSKNIIILCMNVLPSSTDLTTEAKLLSVRIISEAALATSLPLFIPNPTSDFLSAGESLTPSPVIATLRPISWAKVTNLSFVLGEQRETTINLDNTFLTSSSDISLISLSVRATSLPSLKIPHCLATASAVSMQSPVSSIT